MAEPAMHVETFALGDWMTNCHVVASRRAIEAGGPCWIVDAGFDPQRLIDYARQHSLEPAAVVMTHAHVDHMAGLHDVRRQWSDVPILIHDAEAGFLGDPALNLSAFLDRPITAPSATGTLEHGQSLELDGATFEVRHTPGHSPGGVSLYHAPSKLVICGDALFAGSIGRTDFPTSDHATLIRSIREQLLTLPDDTRALPGHGPATTIGEERRTNPFLT